jgi:hypothetical protein
VSDEPRVLDSASDSAVLRTSTSFLNGVRELVVFRRLLATGPGFGTGESELVELVDSDPGSNSDPESQLLELVFFFVVSPESESLYIGFLGAFLAFLAFPFPFPFPGSSSRLCTLTAQSSTNFLVSSAVAALLTSHSVPVFSFRVVDESLLPELLPPYVGGSVTIRRPACAS